MDNIRAAGKEERISDNGKGKYVVYRHEGETVKGEKEVTVSDPRKEAGFKGARVRGDFNVTSYEVREHCSFFNILLMGKTVRLEHPRPTTSNKRPHLRILGIDAHAKDPATFSKVREYHLVRAGARPSNRRANGSCIDQVCNARGGEAGRRG